MPGHSNGLEGPDRRDASTLRFASGPRLWPPLDCRKRPCCLVGVADPGNIAVNLAAIVVAAGTSSRAGGRVPKPYRNLGEEPVLARTIRSLLKNDRVKMLRAVIGTGHEAYFGQVARIVDDARLLPPVVGGATRGESVLAGLVSVETEYVIIHDGARPFPDPSSIEILLDELKQNDAVFLALPVHDTLCYIERDGKIARGPDRQNLWRAQTPQGFRRDAILRAYRAAGTSETDDVSVARAAGIDVVAVPGSETNLKITVPDDFRAAKRILGQFPASPGENSSQSDISDSTGSHGIDDNDVYGDQQVAQPPRECERRKLDIRVGSGFDVHEFTEGDNVILCGVRIPFGKSLDGHSDADVGLHAVTDAVLGAVAAGDIGAWFPPSDDTWQGADSGLFLQTASRHVRESGYQITNIDCTIICELPKIQPYTDEMCERIATAAGIDRQRVNVKATTTEGLGFPGRGEGIAAMAIVTVARP